MSLEPLREKISEDSLERLTNCLAVCLGIDALMVLRDICGVSGKKAEELMVWMAIAIVEQGMSEADKEQQLLANVDDDPTTTE